MAKVARKATKEKALPRQRRKRVHIYTAWHPLIVV
jgi:hypothetical protein